MLRPLTHRQSAEYSSALENAVEIIEECRSGWYYTLMSFAQGVARKQILPASKRSQSLIQKILKESVSKFESSIWKGV